MDMYNGEGTIMKVMAVWVEGGEGEKVEQL